MPPRKRTETAPTDDLPTQRVCATDEVHERLLRTVPGYAEVRSEIENRTSRVLAFGDAVLRTGCTQIPVVVHVLYRNSTENISDAQIQSQIDVLNQDYRATNPDKSSTPSVFQPLIGDARVTFKLADTDPDGNPTNGITRTSTNNTSFNSDTDNAKHASTGGHDAWPADRYLNIWTCGNLRSGAGQALLGYAQFPGGPADTDGVVILQSAFGNTGTAAAPFNLGRTATHEIGHWLNLRHIWGDDGTGCTGDDFVADTPNAGGPNYGKPTFPHITCNNGPNGDLFMNYMDYVDDDSMFMFTQGQVTRMQAALDGPRSTVGTTGPCDGIAAKPIPKEIVKELPKDTPKDFIKEPIKELPKDFPKDFPKDPPKDFPKDPPKDFPKDPPKEFPKEHLHKEIIKELPKELHKDITDDLTKPIRDVGGGKAFTADPPIPDPGPLNPGVLTGGGTPFVLGGGRDQTAGGADPLLAVVQQLGMLLAAYNQTAAQGGLDARATARWQQLSAIYAQLVALLQ